MSDSSDSDELFARLKAEMPQSSPAVDPSTNVLSLVAAAMKRQDDLREAEDKWSERVRTIEERCGTEKESLREKLREAESARINAIRAVDVAAVALANERGNQQASVLANQVSTSAETLRALVATTADQNSKTLAGITNQLADRLTLLEKSQYQIGGRDLQRGEGRTQQNWLTGIIIVIGVAVVQILLRLVGT